MNLVRILSTHPLRFSSIRPHFRRWFNAFNGRRNVSKQETYRLDDSWRLDPQPRCVETERRQRTRTGIFVVDKQTTSNWGQIHGRTTSCQTVTLDFETNKIMKNELSLNWMVFDWIEWWRTRALGVALSYMDRDRRKVGRDLSDTTSGTRRKSKWMCSIGESGIVLTFSSWLNCFVAFSLRGVAISWFNVIDVGKLPSSSLISFNSILN